MSTQNLTTVIAQVSKDKGIDTTVLVDALEASILTAAKKVFGYERQLEASFDEERGQIELFQYMEVVAELEDPETQLDLKTARKVDPDVEPGDELGFQIFYLIEDADRAREEDDKYGDILRVRQQRNTFGRIAAQTAKQVIIQRVREAERDIVFNEYKDRKGELVTGISRRFERGDVVVDLGRAEAVLPVREQMPRESYRAGDRVQAYVKDVSKAAKGPQIILSRTDTGLIMKLFEMEVPEIYEGIVRIVNVAREPGERTKIAVASSDTDVDPVGACVGMKGSRVQAVVQELRGEKIDIVPWSSDIARFVCHAIAPADVSRVLIDEDTSTIELIVGDDQLSLAIGRRGQNVRLASQLVGWKIEIHSETKIDAMKEELKTHLLALEADGLDDSTIEYLFKLGFHSADNLMNAHEGDLTMIPGVTDETVARIKQVAKDLKASGSDVHRGREREPVVVRQVVEEVTPPHDREIGRLELVRGLTGRLLGALLNSGYETVEAIAEEDNLAKLARVETIGIKKARHIRESARKYLAEEKDAGGYEAMMSDIDLEGEAEEAARVAAEAAATARAAADAAREVAAIARAEAAALRAAELAAAEEAAAIPTPEEVV
jgi:N utilization substance protein A